MTTYPSDNNTGRRSLMRGTAGLAALGAIVPFAPQRAGLVAAASAQPKEASVFNHPGKHKGLALLGDKPLVAETPEHLLDDDTTPTDKFFVRNNGGMPDEARDPDGWKISVEGEVNAKLELTLG